MFDVKRLNGQEVSTIQFTRELVLIKVKHTGEKTTVQFLHPETKKPILDEVSLTASGVSELSVLMAKPAKESS